MVWQQRKELTKAEYAELFEPQAEPSMLILDIHSNQTNWQHRTLKEMRSDPRSASFPEFDLATTALVMLVLPKNGGDMSWTLFTMPLPDQYVLD